MNYLVICAIALSASCLTFFSGFGLGTMLLPAFALFFPVEQAIAMTAVVHMLNGLFKLALVGRHADRAIVLRFGLPAVAAALLGAWVLQWLVGLTPVYRYAAFDHALEVTPVKLAVGLLLLVFALSELLPRLRDLTFPSNWMPVGGVLSGFFGGLAGMQGALRSAFLVHARQALDYPLLAAAIVSAFIGALVGNRFLKQLTMPGLQRLVAAALLLAASGLVAGVL